MRSKPTPLTKECCFFTRMSVTPSGLKKAMNSSPPRKKEAVSPYLFCRSSKNLGVSLRNLRVRRPPRDFGPLGRFFKPFLDLMAWGLAGYSTGRSAVYGLAMSPPFGFECNQVLGLVLAQEGLRGCSHPRSTWADLSFVFSRV